MSYSCDKVFSHPEKLLEDHLRSVAQTSRNWIKSLRLNFDVDKEVIADVSCIIGLAHDLGKSTNSFQTYLLTTDEEMKQRLKNHKETRHSPLGAFCGYYMIQEYLKIKKAETDHANFLPIAGVLTILRHHGDLNTLVTETSKYKADDISEYLKDVDDASFDKMLASILNLIPCLIHCNYGWFEEKIKNFDKDLREIRTFARSLGRRKDLYYFFITSLFYSCLVDADKSDASGLNIDYRKNTIPGDLVDKYKRIMGYDKPITELNKLRNEIYQVSTDITKAIEEGKHILSINVPTGTGKTLNALSAALKIKDFLYSKEGTSRSIVYGLPFTSIIDQNFQVFHEVFKKVNTQEPGNDILLKHHYLADAFYKLTENNDEYLEYSPLESRFIIEGWNSSIIVTTFIQLFHSLITNRNSASKKIHRIVNSIIILDEVQAIPHKYWQLLRQICNYMALYMDTYFIFVTATLPLIFPKDEIYELVANKEFYYEKLNRINLETYTEDIIEIDDYKEIIIQEAISNKEKDILIVMNTIKSAQIMYQELLNNLGTEENTFIYLSSHVVPFERKQRICKIKEEQGKRKIVVSTQLIEAGVDIDLDIVFRDFGPLDSINQVAGRCNRNQEKGRGVVKVYYVKRSNRPDSSFIYDGTLLNATQKTIATFSYKPYIEEKDFFKLSNKYYQLLNQGILSTTESQTVLEAVHSLNYAKISEFKLIEESYEKIDIFVEIDENAREVWNKFLALSEIEDKWKRKEEFYRFKNEFQQYIISVQKNPKLLYPFANSIVGGIIHINMDIVDIYYKTEGKGDTGFQTEGDTIAVW